LRPEYGFLIPVWFDQQHILFRQCSANLREGLACEGSLTEYLSQFCPCDLELEIKSEKWQASAPGEILQNDHWIDRNFYIREINLSCSNKPLIYGRSLFPRTSYVYCKRQLDKLGDRPLGEWLFSDKRIYRLNAQIGKIGKHTRLYQLAMSGLSDRPVNLWGRRSVYSVNGYPLLVIEIFLPPLIKCIDTWKKAKIS